MRSSKSAARPGVLVITNENPDWPEDDKAWNGRMLGHMSEALDRLGYRHEVHRVYSDLKLLERYDPREWVVWNWVEELGGQPWSDAVAARVFERRGFSYTGATSRALAGSVDRMQIKQQLIRAGLPTLPGLRLSHPRQATRWKTYPAIVKGATQHGSFGIDHASVVHSAEELAERIVWLREHLKSDAQVEKFLDTREFHIGVLSGANGKLDGLPPGEIDYTAFEHAEDRVYSYGYKHDETNFGYHAVKVRVPAAIPPRLSRRLKALACSALDALGARDYGRIDVRMDGDEPMILDVNVNCDLDATSVLMRAAGARGLTYTDVVGRIVQGAVQRQTDALTRRLRTAREPQAEAVVAIA